MGHSSLLMKPITVVETAPFIRHAAGLLSDEERQEFIDFIARHPEAGAVIKETGGARKVRWAREGGGKSGSVRTIYHYHDEDAPLFLLTIHGKGEKSNLSANERKSIAKAIEGMKGRIRADRLAPAGV